MANKTNAYYTGYEAKKEEIKNLGFDAARDEFNRAVPPGQKWNGSAEGLQYANGEAAALMDDLNNY